MDILTADNLVTNIDLICWPVCLSRMGGDGVKWVDVGYRYFSPLRAVNENLVQHLSNILLIKTYHHTTEQNVNQT